MSSPSLVIRNGTIVDGSGGDPYEADLAVTDGKISSIGGTIPKGAEEIDARGKLVTPGFVDVHTHYDAQVTWSDRLSPSSWNGATTVLLHGAMPAGLRAEIAAAVQATTVPALNAAAAMPRRSTTCGACVSTPRCCWRWCRPNSRSSNDIPTHHHTPPSPAARRLFLRQASALSGLGLLGTPLALNLAAASSAAAQSASDYKALVCIFMHGGNDAMNTVLATDAASWQSYVAARQQAPDSIALLPAGTPAVASAAAGAPQRLGGVLPIVPLRSQGRGFALHPLLGTVQSLFQQQRLAVVANVGPLLQPTSKAQYLRPTHPRPPQLFSHNDQQNAWQAFHPEGAQVGWGGRMGDLLAAGNAVSALTAISTAAMRCGCRGRRCASTRPARPGRCAWEPTRRADCSDRWRWPQRCSGS